MPTELKYDEEKVIRLILRHHGNLSMVAKSLRCGRATLYRYANNTPAIEEALHEARETITDIAESKLLIAIEEGQAWAVCFYLKTQGKSRGYVERQEVTGKDGAPLKGYIQISPDDWDKSD